MRVVLYVLVTVVVLAAAGCGETTLDTAELESELAKGVEEDTGTEDVEVDCPDDIEQEKGRETECDVAAPGGIRAVVVATQTDDDGSVDWKLRRP